MALLATTAAICQTNPVIITPDSLSVSQSSVIPETEIIDQLVKANKDLKKIEKGKKPENIIIHLKFLAILFSICDGRSIQVLVTNPFDSTSGLIVNRYFLGIMLDVISDMIAHTNNIVPI